ncbi:uncharacterized protein N7498_007286 [Penicillium cinerascens]|uniref:Isopenicillin N synthase-like Fe(2+) 2OG dioxygenase domain-containing protein n=1 Tax=Penicillium cinerascens TaxID=70096 RepID=A0A9W9JKV2_9EURO|nr:uncharacterized protein N7498_007286 [Penicillium cinerascens]KAJ5198169.1 hypothetical protein N7498_007286 [Penicillium cinerascens]
MAVGEAHSGGHRGQRRRNVRVVDGGGYYKATIHRVCQPPADQRNQDRCGLFYFVVPNNHVKINTLLDESPVLRRAGVERKFEPGTEPTSES